MTARTRPPLTADTTLLALAAHFGPLVRLALCVALLAPLSIGAQSDLGRRVGSVFAAHQQEPETDLERQLAALGLSAFPSLFDCLRDGQYWVSTDEGFESHSLTLDQTSSLLAAFARFPGPGLKSLLRERTTDEPTAENRRTALRLLAPIARKSDLAFCMQLAQPLSPDMRVDMLAAEHLQRCLEQLLTESSSTLRSLRTTFERAHLDLRSTIISAVTNVGTDDGLQALSEFLTLTDELELFILSSMGRVAATATLPVDGIIIARVRQLEGSDDPRRVREALLLLGRFEDAESVPRLIDRLEDEDQGIRSAAHWSLKHLSGLALREDPLRWRMWHKTEADWWKVHAPEVLGWLRSFDVLDRKRAVAIISQRRLRKHTLALELLPLLSDSDESVIKQTLRALSILDARSAAPKVQELLEHHSQEVRESAEATLARWQAPDSK